MEAPVFIVLSMSGKAKSQNLREKGMALWQQM